MMSNSCLFACLWGISALITGCCNRLCDGYVVPTVSDRAKDYLPYEDYSFGDFLIYECPGTGAFDTLYLGILSERYGTTTERNAFCEEECPTSQSFGTSIYLDAESSEGLGFYFQANSARSNNTLYANQGFQTLQKPNVLSKALNKAPAASKLKLHA